MGLFSKLRGRTVEVETDTEDHECLHASLTPHWDRLDDMGNDDKATSWTCTSCNQAFSPAERSELLRTEADRLKRAVGQPT